MSDGEPANLILYPHEWTGNRMTQEHANIIIPFLKVQPFLANVEWRPSPEGIILDLWRKHYKNHQNIADLICSAFGQHHWSRKSPWLMVPEEKFKAKVIFVRSPRYWSWTFPWQKVYDKYHLDAIHLGTPEEHADLVQGCGPIKHIHTDNYLEAAEIIAAASLVVSNQTGLYWVAESLKKQIVLEAFSGCQNCHFDRDLLHYHTNEYGFLPNI